MNTKKRIVKQIRQYSLIQIVFCLFTLGSLTFLYRKYQFSNKSLEFTLLCVGNLIAAAGATINSYQFRKTMKRISSLPLEKKLVAYRHSAMVRNVIITVVSLLFSVSFFLTGAGIFQLEAMLGAFLLVIYYPSTVRLARELKSDIQEVDRFS